jgi:hypothetical protein
VNLLKYGSVDVIGYLPDDSKVSERAYDEGLVIDSQHGSDGEA